MTSRFEPRDPDFQARVRASFGRQRLMQTIGARLVLVSAGEVEIEALFREDLTQQHGSLHAAVVTALVDSACGYSALSLAPLGSEVLTVEYKVSFLSPAKGERFLARGRVVRAGQTISGCAPRRKVMSSRWPSARDETWRTIRPASASPGSTSATRCW